MTASQALAVLGLQGQVTQGEARRAYLDLVKVWHPDRFAGDQRLQAKALAQLTAINAAYEFLSAGWDLDPISVAPRASPVVPEPPGTSDPRNPPRAVPSSIKYSRPATSWVAWALAIGVAWSGAFYIFGGGGPGPGITNRRPAPLQSQLADVGGAVPDRPIDAAPHVPQAEQARRPNPQQPQRLAATPASGKVEAKIDPDKGLLRQVYELLRPENGEELELVLTDGREQDIGRGILNVDNGTKWDGVMVLSRLGVERRAFYIQAGSRATMSHLGANAYEAKFMLGTWWTGAGFDSDQHFLKFDKPLVFVETEDVDKITTSDISVSLHPVRGGTAKSSRIPPFRLAVR